MEDKLQELDDKLSSVLPRRFTDKIIADIKYVDSLDIDCTVALFGSCARGAVKVDSDVDLAIITESKLDRCVKSDIATALEPEVQGIGTDVVFFTRSSFKTAESLLVREIRKDGVILWQKGTRITN